MKLFHGTTKENLKSIELDGVASPSYWGTESLAQNYANSFGNDGVVLVAAIDESALEINKLVVEQLYENGDIEEFPDENDLTFSPPPAREASSFMAGRDSAHREAVICSELYK